MSDTVLAVSAKNLGRLNVDNYCPRCLWFLVHIKFHPPFSFGGQLFNDAERCEKAILGYYLEKDGCLPKPFGPVQDCCERIDYPQHWSKFWHTHESGVALYGIPDEILKRADGTLCVIDHKTARAKDGNDPFYGQYAAQVNAYGYIAEGLGLGEVSLGALLYWEARVEAVEDDPGKNSEGGTVWMPLKVKPVPVKIDYSLLDDLMEEFKDITDAAIPPDSRKGCDDCKKLDLLFAIDQNLRLQDHISLRQNQDIDTFRKAIKQRISNRENHLRNLLEKFEEGGEDFFASDGMITNWDFDDDLE